MMLYRDFYQNMMTSISKVKTVVGSPPLTIKNALNAAALNYRIYGSANGVGNRVLPEEYTRVEYIRNNTLKKAAIDTGVIPNLNTRVELDAQAELYTANAAKLNFLCGARTDASTLSGRYDIYYSDTLKSYVLSLGDATQAGNRIILSPVNDFLRHNFVMDSKTKSLTIDGVLSSKEEPFDETTWTDSTVPLHLFAASYDATTFYYSTYMKIYGCRIYKNDVLVRDFIPCKRNSDSIYGLYDLVNSKFYSNKHAGSLTAIGGGESFSNYSINLTNNSEKVLEIYFDSALQENEYIDFQSQKIIRTSGTEEPVIVPEFILNKGSNIISVEGNILPDKIEIKYKK